MLVACRSLFVFVTFLNVALVTLTVPFSLAKASFSSCNSNIAAAGSKYDVWLSCGIVGWVVGWSML